MTKEAWLAAAAQFDGKRVRVAYRHFVGGNAVSGRLRMIKGDPLNCRVYTRRGCYTILPYGRVTEITLLEEPAHV